jgi:predicted DNA-binding transcriptional regulator AlpA
MTPPLMQTLAPLTEVAVPDVELWPCRTVVGKAGISKTEIYRRMKDRDPALNPFPQSFHRPGRKQGVFWASVDVLAWQVAEMGLTPSPHPTWPSAWLGLTSITIPAHQMPVEAVRASLASFLG